MWEKTQVVKETEINPGCKRNRDELWSFKILSEVNIYIFKALTGIMDTVSQLSTLISAWCLDFFDNFLLCLEKNEDGNSGWNLASAFWVVEKFQTFRQKQHF